LLDQPERRARLTERFRQLHEELRCDAASQAAGAVAELLDPPAC
jgi:lipid A disaccharide synthetase